jgi:hypothetical protein
MTVSSICMTKRLNLLLETAAFYAYVNGNPISRVDRRGLSSDPMGDEARALATAGPWVANNPVEALSIAATIVTLPVSEL